MDFFICNNLNLCYNIRALGVIIMENVNIEELDDQSLVELLNILQGLDDELKEEGLEDEQEN